MLLPNDPGGDSITLSSPSVRRRRPSGAHDHLPFINSATPPTVLTECMGRSLDDSELKPSSSDDIVMLASPSSTTASTSPSLNRSITPCTRQNKGGGSPNQAIKNRHGSTPTVCWAERNAEYLIVKTSMESAMQNSRPGVSSSLEASSMGGSSEWSEASGSFTRKATMGHSRIGSNFGYSSSVAKGSRALVDESFMIDEVICPSAPLSLDWSKGRNFPRKFELSSLWQKVDTSSSSGSDLDTYVSQPRHNSASSDNIGSLYSGIGSRSSGTGSRFPLADWLSGKSGGSGEVVDCLFPLSRELQKIKHIDGSSSTDCLRSFQFLTKLQTVSNVFYPPDPSWGTLIDVTEPRGQQWLKDIRRHFKYVLGGYPPHVLQKHGIQIISRSPEENLKKMLSASTKHPVKVLRYVPDSAFAQPAHHVLLDEKRQEFIVVVRGTCEVSDHINEAFCLNKPLRLHQVFAAAAEWVHGEIFESLVMPTMRFRPQVKLILVGHSYGAGVVSLLTLKWLEMSEKLFGLLPLNELHSRFKTVCFGPPCVAHPSFGYPALRKIITSIVFGSDVVSRTSFLTLDDLIQMVVAVNSLNWRKGSGGNGHLSPRGGQRSSLGTLLSTGRFVSPGKKRDSIGNASSMSPTNSPVSTPMHLTSRKAGSSKTKSPGQIPPLLPIGGTDIPPLPPKDTSTSPTASSAWFTDDVLAIKDLAAKATKEHKQMRRSASPSHYQTKCSLDEIRRITSSMECILSRRKSKAEDYMTPLGTLVCIIPEEDWVIAQRMRNGEVSSMKTPAVPLNSMCTTDSGNGRGSRTGRGSVSPGLRKSFTHRSASPPLNRGLLTDNQSGRTPAASSLSRSLLKDVLAIKADTPAVTSRRSGFKFRGGNNMSERDECLTNVSIFNSKSQSIQNAKSCGSWSCRYFQLNSECVAKFSAAPIFSPMSVRDHGFERMAQAIDLHDIIEPSWDPLKYRREKY